jgi:TatD DNase family protein
MELIDTHCHIQSIGSSQGETITRQLWAKDSTITVDNVIERARKANVNRLIVVGCDPTDSQLAVQSVQNRQGCFAAIGIHPHETKLYKDKNWQSGFESLIAAKKVVAIGECGLDYYYLHSPKEDQIKLLRFQIELALSASLPIVFHVRDAFSDFWPIFDSYSSIRGVLHSYTDNRDNLNKALARDLYIGVNGIVTFMKDSTKRELFNEVPLERILLETDAPYLTPVPYRGKVNEPRNIALIASFLADLRQTELAEIASITTNSACNLFGLEK